MQRYEEIGWHTGAALCERLQHVAYVQRQPLPVAHFLQQRAEAAAHVQRIRRKREGVLVAGKR